MKISKKKFFRRSAAAVTAIAVAAGLFTAAGSQEAEAGSRLYGVQQVINELNNDINETYQVVEIVPDSAYASLGYLVSGSEPEIDGKLLESYTSKANREAAVDVLLGRLEDAGYLSSYTYSERLYNTSNSADCLDGSLTHTGEVTEERTGYYEEKSQIADLTDGYNYNYLPQCSISMKFRVQHAESNDVEVPDPSYAPVAGDKLKFQTVVANNSDTEITGAKVEYIDGDGNDLDTQTIAVAAAQQKEVVYTLDTTDKAGQSLAVYAKVTIGEDVYYTNEITVNISSAAVVTKKAAITHTVAVTANTENANYDVAGTVVITPDTASGTVLSDLTAVTVTYGTNTIELTQDTTDTSVLKYTYTAVSDDGAFSAFVTMEGFTQSSSSELALVSLTEAGSLSVSGDASKTSVPETLDGSWRTDKNSNKDKVSSAYYSYVGENQGSYVWVDDTAGSEYSVTYRTLYYDTAPVSTNLFGTKVLELETNSALLNRIKVSTYTPEAFEKALAEGVLKIDDIDFLYVSNSAALDATNLPKDGDTSVSVQCDTYILAEEQEDSSYVYTNDLSWDVVYSIYEAVLNESMPVVLDRSIYADSADAANRTQMLGGCNIMRLAYLLRNYAAISTGKTSVFSSNHDEDIWTEAFVNKVVGTDTVTYGTYGLVSGSVFLYGDHNNGNLAYAAVDGESYYDTLDSTILEYSWNSKQVKSGYNTAASYLTNMQEVLDEIENDTFYGMTDTTTSTSSATPVEYSTGVINKATMLKYIINYHYRRISIYKDSITVLDLEPGKYSSLTESMIRGWLTTEESAHITTIKIVQMSTSEFIGKLTDLQEDYDMVYIGGTDNSDATVDLNPTINNRTLLYSHIGRQMTSGEAKWGGLLDSEYTTNTSETGGTYTTEYKYSKVTDAGSLENGTYLIVSAGNSYAVQNGSDLKIDYDVSTAVNDTAALSNMNSYTWTITSVDDGYTIKSNNPNYTNTYLSLDNTDASAKSTTSPQHLKFIANGENGAVSIQYTSSGTESYSAQTVNHGQMGASYSQYVGYYYKEGSNYYLITGIEDGGGPKKWAITYNGSEHTINNAEYITLYTKSGGTWTVYLNNNNGSAGITDTTGTATAFYLYKVTSETKQTTPSTTVTTRALNNASITTRYSGNDITEEKLEDLLDFVEASYPVVVDSKLLGSGKTVSTTYLDSTSYLYQFLAQAKDDDNVFSTASVGTNFAKYLNMSKVYLTMIDWPTDYTETDNNGTFSSQPDFLQADDTTGKYYLDYTFEFSSTTLSTSAANTYTVKLYEDVNSDGKYSSTEELDGLVVTNAVTGETVNYNQLLAGVRYNVRRQLPDDLVGLIPWRLEITMNNTDGQVHTSQIGYTAISPKNNSTVSSVDLNILQIVPENCTVDLSTDPTFSTLFNQVRSTYGYNISVVTKTVSEITEEYLTSAVGTLGSYAHTAGNSTKSVEDYYNYLEKNYNMLILGFADTYEDFGTEEVAQAIEKYIDAGNSVLFSHDTTSFDNATRSEQLAGGIISHDSSLYTGGNISYLYFYTADATKVCFKLDSNGKPETYDYSQSVQHSSNSYYITSGGKNYYISTDSSWVTTVTDGDGTSYNVCYKPNLTGVTYVHYWGYSLNQYVRSIVGMDRFGVTTVTSLSGLSKKTDSDRLANNTATKTILSAALTADKDLAFTPGSGTVTKNASGELTYSSGLTADQYVQGFNNYLILDKESTYTDQKINTRTKRITQVNQGQITTYPYNINLDAATRSLNGGYYSNTYSKLSIALTHYQYYQLDMNLDKTGDGQSDIVVWYCLSGSSSDSDQGNDYVETPNDVRNAYYIYSAGNVTYTGMGHDGNITTDEAKLFVNTIIASYNSGTKPPTVTLCESSTSKLSLDNLYRTFDETAMDSSSDITETIGFYVNDYNIINGEKYLGYWFYYQDPSVTETQYNNELVNGEEVTCFQYSTSSGTVYLRPYTIAELSGANSPIVWKSLDTKTATEYAALSEDDKKEYVLYTDTAGAKIYLRKLTNNQASQATLSGTWIDAQLAASDTVKVYIGAWTYLEYSTTQAPKTTDPGFDYLVIKRRDLMDLD